ISPDASFANLFDEDRVALNRYVHDQPLEPGHYYWRVRAIPHGKEPTEWSAPLDFAINPPDLVITVDVSVDPVRGVSEAIAKAKEV
ncbi:MAG: hypothetical protein ACPG4K_13900, partial [Haloferula sp.]